MTCMNCGHPVEDHDQSYMLPRCPTWPHRDQVDNAPIDDDNQGDFMLGCFLVVVALVLFVLLMLAWVPFTARCDDDVRLEETAQEHNNC